MCAIEAGKRGRRVVVLEHQARMGRKILISGGGRCNFTNLHCRPENFLSANPHFAKSALARYQPRDFIALVEKHRIPYHEKKLGQLFCDGSAQEIVTLLERECAAARVRIVLSAKVNEVSRSNEFVVRTNCGEFRAPALVVASGGLSIPKIGATPWGYEIARQFGLKIRECRAALVPITFDAQDRAHYCDLAGVSCEVVAASEGRRFREKMLITHRGLSGPAILQISTYWNRKQPIVLDLAPERAVLAELKQASAGRNLGAAKAALHAVLPARLAERWLEVHPPSNGPTPRSTRWNDSFISGRCFPPERKDTRRPRSPPAALIPMNCRPRRWRVARFPACSSLAKSWM